MGWFKASQSRLSWYLGRPSESVILNWNEVSYFGEYPVILNLVFLVIFQLEVLKQLQDGESLSVLGPSLELHLAPPRKDRPRSAPITNSSSTSRSRPTQRTSVVARRWSIRGCSSWKDLAGEVVCSFHFQQLVSVTKHGNTFNCVLFTHSNFNISIVIGALVVYWWPCVQSKFLACDAETEDSFQKWLICWSAWYSGIYFSSQSTIHLSCCLCWLIHTFSLEKDM